MTFSHGIAATLQIGLLDLEGYAESLSMDLRRELAEIRPMDGDGAVQRVAGLRDVTFTADGPYDPTADASLFAAYDGDVVVTVTFMPDGSVSYVADCFIESYSINATSSDKATYTVTLQGAAATTRP